MRFKGVAMTDDLADPGVTTLESVPDAAVLALRAGADALYISGGAGDQQAAYVAVLRAVQRGRIPRAPAGRGGRPHPAREAGLRADPLRVRPLTRSKNR